MNKILSLCLISAAVFFLPACLWKKKKDVSNDQTISCDYVDSDKTISEEHIHEKKMQIDGFLEKDNIEEKNISDANESIFSDDEDDDSDDKVDFISNQSKNKKDIVSLSEDNESNIKGLNLGTAYFDFDVFKKFNKTSEASAAKILKEIKQLIKENKVSEISIEGHACNSSGSHRYNMQLSQRRAENFRKYLINNGINADLITTCGHGILELIVKEGNKEEQAPNRRIEVLIYN